MMVAAIKEQILIFGGATLVSLTAFMGLILVPTLGSFGRIWEKAAAIFLSLFVLLALVLIGIAVGLVIVYEFPDVVSSVFG